MIDIYGTEIAINESTDIYIKLKSLTLSKQIFLMQIKSDELTQYTILSTKMSLAWNSI